MADILAFDRSRVRAPQHQQDALALLAFPELLNAAEVAFAERMARSVRVRETERLRLFGICVEIGRARFREDRP
ncbi:hypothetical protein ACFSCW_03295 [Sphingomonas tabacisoli]|uniref:Uncharacterized protein n=1 Tax=Sphingomonas tabacisoli TaxID=2249466 RepID=A0ABW4HYS8_9SPHN